jgi:hypothetical protein
MVSMALRGGASGWIRSAAVAALLASAVATASAAELVGRVVDQVQARVFEGATVTARGGDRQNHAAQTDGQGFFRVPGLAAGWYVLDVSLPDGRAFVARLVMLPNRQTQFLELDYSRAVPPDDDEDY